MENQNNINTLDEALRILWLESSKEADVLRSENEIRNILESDHSSEMSADEQSLMINKLTVLLSTPSFGHQLKAAIASSNIPIEVLSEKTSLAIEMIEDLKLDKIFTNNIPVVFLKTLLQQLNLSFKSVEQSIWKTYNVLKSGEFVSNNSISQPSFRRNQINSRDTYLKINSTTDGKELFENEQALTKYLSKLEEIMK